MRKPILLLAGLAAAFGAMPAMAGDADGKVQVKLLATAVLPDGEIDSVETDLGGLPAALQTEANDNVVRTVAVEYLFTPAVSVEAICCGTHAAAGGIGGLAAADP